ncbi:hypothetical protein DH2020_023985 [Rehmannia glutinosa]|uniref:QWRF motif-containing protein n=1 Tax=Rehmannia glutinosa TaxID=99300 RepID=A0ABR0WBG6_REHGL
MMVAAAVSDSQNPKTAGPQDEHSRRPPLLPSEKDNSNGFSNNQRKPKSRVVSSRYLSPSTSTSTSNSSSVSSSSSSSSRRYPSPLISRNSTQLSNVPSVGPKRSVSADRRRPAAARPLIPDLDSQNSNSPEISAATKLLVTSTRSLSVSFQGEAFSLPISKTKVTPSSPNLSSVRKGTPERRRNSTPTRGKADGGGDQVENSKPSDQHRWPARNRLVTPLSRSLDCNGSVLEKSKLIGSGNAIRGMQQSMMIDEKRPSVDKRFSLDGNSVMNELSVSSDLIPSDSDSVSSDSTSGVQECSQNGPRGMAVSARFWQETNSRLRRLQDPGSPLSTSPKSKLIVPPKLKRYSSDGPLSSPRTMSSPVRGVIRAASPSKLMASSPLRGHSPSRIRNAVSTISNNFVETPSVLSFAVDVRRGKWRFVNARSEAVLLVQKHGAEKNLWNAWIAISDLRDTVTKKRHRLQLLRQKLKLASILRGQMTLLEDWASLEQEHSISLLGAIEALKASTLRLPVANVQSLKDAIGSAVDVMQAMGSSICSCLPMVEEVNSLVTELAKLTAKERALLEQCMDLISFLAAMQHDRFVSPVLQVPDKGVSIRRSEKWNFANIFSIIGVEKLLNKFKIPTGVIRDKELVDSVGGSSGGAGLNRERESRVHP